MFKVKIILLFFLLLTYSSKITKKDIDRILTQIKEQKEEEAIPERKLFYPYAMMNSMSMMNPMLMGMMNPMMMGMMNPMMMGMMNPMMMGMMNPMMMGMLNPMMMMNPHLLGLGMFGGALRQAGENEDGLNRKLNKKNPERFLKDWKKRVGEKIFNEEMNKIDKEIERQGYKLK